MSARNEDRDETLPPAEPEPARIRRWCRERLVLPAVLYAMFVVALGWFLTHADAWVVDIVLEGHSRHVHDARFSTDGRFVVTASYDGTARLWDAESGRCVRVLSRKAGLVCSAVVSPNNELIIMGDAEGTSVWRLATGELVATLGARGEETYVVEFSPDGKSVLARHYSRPRSGYPEVGIWDTTTWQCRTVLRPFNAAATFHADSKRVLTGSSESVLLWDASTGKRLALLAVPELAGSPLTGGVMVIAYLALPKKILGACRDGSITIWDAETLAREAVLDTRFIWGWDPQNPVVAVLVDHPYPYQAAWDEDSISYSTDGRRIVTCAGSDAYLWDGITGALLRKLDDRFWMPMTAFSPDNARFVTGGGCNEAQIWNAEKGEFLAQLVQPGKITVMAFSPDGERLLTAGHGGTVRIWRRRRPEWWWGVFWLWQFWMIAALAGAFGVSLWRDLRARGSAELAEVGPAESVA